MKYQNIKTGFVFESDSICLGEDWLVVQPSPDPVKEEKKATEETEAKSITEPKKKGKRVKK